MILAHKRSAIIWACSGSPLMNLHVLPEQLVARAILPTPTEDANSYGGTIVGQNAADTPGQ
jgi:hypothetical protein